MDRRGPALVVTTGPYRGAMGTVADLLFAPHCVGCGRAGAALCRPCAGELRPAPAGELVAGADRVLAAWVYEGAARSLVLSLKLSGSEPAAAALGEALARVVRARGIRGELIAWVPARRRDIRARGFDHAEAIARAVAARLGLRPAPLLTRCSPARDQAGLSRSERDENLSGVFSARRFCGRVVLVDDLVTTGATARACVAALRRAGARGVEVLAACRA